MTRTRTMFTSCMCSWRWISYAVEMIDIVLDKKEHNYGISQGFGMTMIIVACLSFLLSLWPMIETKLHGKKKTISTISRNAVEIFLVNGPFLIIRLETVFSYGKDESIHQKHHSDNTFCSWNSWWTCLIMKYRTRATDYWTTKPSTETT